VAEGAGEVSLPSRILRTVAGVLTALMALAIIVAPRMSFLGYSQWGVAAIIAALALLWGLGSRPLASVLRGVIPADWTGAVVGVLLVLLNAVVAAEVAYFGAYRAGWDAGVIRGTAGLPPQIWEPYYLDYFARYPNNHAMLGLADAAVWSTTIGLGYVEFFAILAGLIMALTATAVYRVVALCRGPQWGVPALLVLLVLVSVSPWMSVAYTDLVGVWVPVTAVWLIVVAVRRRGVAGLVALLGAGLVLGVGYLIKATSIVGLVAALVVLGFALVTRRGLRLRLVAAIVALGVGFVAGLSGTTALLKATVPLPELKEGVVAAPLTYVAGGLTTSYYTGSDEVSSYGGYSAEVDDHTWDIPTEEQSEVSRRIIDRELADRGFWGTVRFEVDKLLFNNGDGMFWAYGEGGDLERIRTHRYFDDPTADALARFNTPDGDLWPARVDFTQAIWLAVMLATGVGLVLLRRKLSPEAAVGIDLMVWNLLGIIAFMLLFQGRSRYLFGHVPVIIALAMSVLPLGLRWVRPRSAKRALPADAP